MLLGTPRGPLWERMYGLTFVTSSQKFSQYTQFRNFNVQKYYCNKSMKIHRGIWKNWVDTTMAVVLPFFKDGNLRKSITRD